MRDAPEKRDEAATLLQELSEGTKTFHEVQREWPGGSEDVMFDAVLRMVREHHTLIDAYDDEDADPEQARDLIDRCIAFLRSDASYEWPPMAGQRHIVSTLRAIAVFVFFGWAVIFMGMFMSVPFIIGGILVAISYFLERRHRREFREAGDMDYWPFVDEQQNRRCMKRQ